MKNFLSLVVLLLVSTPLTYSQTQPAGKKKVEPKKVEMKKAEIPAQKVSKPEARLDKQIPKVGKKLVTRAKATPEKSSKK
ncbi:MAG: hypothetical protein J0L62_11435 [Bacteroidetes bacterium]|nr:hypothetical protein [Bacteroidota bacterium]